MNLSMKDFYHQIQKLAGEYFPAAKLETQEINRFRLKMRITLSSTSFIDIFYGVRKTRIDFALVKEGKRIFGIDNLSGWHRHPLNEADCHEFIKEMSFQEICSQLAKIVQQN